jgi:hypothetical protein
VVFADHQAAGDVIPAAPCRLTSGTVFFRCPGI